MPDCLNPPKGVVTRTELLELMEMVPVSSARATRVCAKRPNNTRPKLTPDSKAVLSLAREDAGMNTNKTRTLLFGSAVAGAMLFGGVIGATVLAKSTMAPAGAAPNTSTYAAPLAVTTAAPTSNEDPAHEATESADREAAENNGTARPAGPAGAAGTSNETAAHEAGESKAQEAAEDARKSAAPAAPAAPAAVN
jgi:hypothetical protein